MCRIHPERKYFIIKLVSNREKDYTVSELSFGNLMEQVQKTSEMNGLLY